MTCPVCKTDTLREITLLEGFPANQCPTCGGIWIPSNSFMSWKRAQGNQSEEINDMIAADTSWEINELKLCPASGHLLVRYKIFPDVDFYLDRCRHCNGIWMDKHEWDVLVSQNLHNHLNEFFTHVWQEKLHTAETKNNMDMLTSKNLARKTINIFRRSANGCRIIPNAACCWRFYRRMIPTRSND
jgi:Zn-finger nucleic acid-binding protein